MPHVCPWLGGLFIDNPVRRLLHDPAKILGPYVQRAMTVMDVGCGMGFFSIAMATMVADQGSVIVVDLQQMLDIVKRRAEKAEHQSANDLWSGNDANRRSRSSLLIGFTTWLLKPASFARFLSFS